MQILGLRVLFLSKRDQHWHLIQESRTFDGGAYREDFLGNTHHAPDIRSESDGTISATAGGGFAFHFWPRSRARIETSDVAGVLVTARALLVLADPKLPDDREQARYLFSVGADYWTDSSTGWNGGRTNRGIAVGRFKYVRSTPRSFNMSTVPEAVMRHNPPPPE
ncbi:MAG TPA: hypothetical protein VMJ10_23885 [Kofleriaceae bacterium]|nr:hypothetical protein [Kofleriaceae bacterium]